jgi:hypothetical protein
MRVRIRISTGNFVPGGKPEMSQGDQSKKSIRQEEGSRRRRPMNNRRAQQVPRISGGRSEMVMENGRQDENFLMLVQQPYRATLNGAVRTSPDHMSLR